MALPLISPQRSAERGQSLVVILMLSALLAFFALALTRMLVKESANVTSTKRRDLAFTAGDAALQRSTSILASSAANWSNPDALPGYASLTVTGYTDVSGVTYYIKIRKGSLKDASNTGAATDWHVNQWANTGSLTNDRTVFVRTVDALGKEDRFFNILHRTDKPFWPGSRGIQTQDCLDTAGWDGDVTDSSGGVCPTPGVTPTPVSCSDGTIQSDCLSASDFCLTKDTSDPGILPTVVIPAGTVPMPGNTLVTQDWSLNADTSFGCVTCTSVNYQVNNLDFGAKTFTFNANAGPIAIFVTGTLTVAGNANFVVNVGNGWTCCKSKGLTIYVKGPGSVTWNGTPTGNFLLYAPESDMTMNGTGNGNFTGAIAAKSVSVNGGGSGNFHYDKCLAQRPAADNYGAPPLLTTQWQQIGLKGQLP